ncbi:MutS protein msh5 [Entomortierella beljakovae]|nr:MutS protein msh5 [Entomortierella beljakovae]
MDFDSTSAQPSSAKHPTRKRPRSELDFQQSPWSTNQSSTNSIPVLKSTEKSISDNAQTLRSISEACDNEIANNGNVDIDFDIPDDSTHCLRESGSSTSNPPYARSSKLGSYIDATRSKHSKSSERSSTPSTSSLRNSEYPSKISWSQSPRHQLSTLNLPIPDTGNKNTTSSTDQSNGLQRDQSILDHSVPESTNDQAIMAVNVKGRTMGISYYDGNQGKLFVMQDTEECNPVTMATIAKVQVCPTLILTSARLDDNVMDALRFDETGQETILEIRPHGDFSYPIAKSRLISTIININRLDQVSDPSKRPRGFMESRPFLPEMDESVQQQAQSRLSNSLNLHSTESVGCAGAIISFLSRQGISGRSARGGGRSLAIFAIKHFAIDAFMFINPNSRSYDSYLKIVQMFNVKDLADIGAFINDVLDFDESIVEGRCVVKHNVDEELDRMRHTYNGLDSFLSEIAKEISSTIPSDFTPTINVIYFPQLGYLITVPMNPDWKTEQDYQLDGLSYQIKSIALMVDPPDLQMSHRARRALGRYSWLDNREIDILQGLQERILEYSQILVTCSDICAELDVLLSLAYVARIRNYKRPLLSEKNILHIVNGRHPLQELVVSSFVANNTHLGDLSGSGRPDDIDEFYATTSCPPTIEIQSESERLYNDNMVMILSGPNSSGKSVYLKQVALITYMAHIGSFVPADSAVIGITDKILTRIQTRETVSSVQSALMTDMQQVIFALEVATDRSLVILDEFGKGTISTDGAGLFCGVIEHLAARTLNKPRVLATTHFHELFENQLLDLTLPISLNTMEVFQEPDSLEATFLFRVIPGKTASSLGPVCAAMAEMPLAIVQRGLYLSRLFQRYEIIVPILTDHEILMQRMYEELVGMLLGLDLDQETSDENESTMVISNQKSCYDENEQDQVLGEPSSCEESTDVKNIGKTDNLKIGGKSNRPASVSRSKRHSCSNTDSDSEKGRKCSNDDHLLESINQLMEYAAKVDKKQQDIKHRA